MFLRGKHASLPKLYSKNPYLKLNMITDSHSILKNVCLNLCNPLSLLVNTAERPFFHQCAI